MSGSMLLRASMMLFLVLPGAAAFAAGPTLPATLPIGAVPGSPVAGQAWTVDDIIETTRIAGVAVQGKGRTVAFVLQQPSVADGRIRYGLYVAGDTPGGARRILESDWIDELQARPGRTTWTVLADLGKGVQLYEVDNVGRTQALIVNPDVFTVGAYAGQVSTASSRPRTTGVLSYEWSPDGSQLWYSRLKLLTAAERRKFDLEGVAYDEATMFIPDFGQAPAAREVELRVLQPASRRDRVIATAPGDRINVRGTFIRNWDRTVWVDDRHVAYQLVKAGRHGRTFTRHIVDTETGMSEPSSGAGLRDAMARHTGDGALAVRTDPNGGRRLFALNDDGTVRRDYGPIEYRRLAQGVWRDAATGQTLLGVQYGDRAGLATLTASPAGATLAQNPDHLSHCSFNADVSFGACARESLARPPELVTVTPATGRIEVVVRPNSRLDRVAPLRTERMAWTNRFGSGNDGYVTWPRDWQPDRKYPAILVTHAKDAQNRFAHNGFQWDYPVQVFAERGWFVLSVNEPVAAEAVSNSYATHTGNIEVAKMQFEMGLNPVASMEAAAQWLIDRGLVDPERIGIAGYSRGSEVTTMTLSQSRLFRAGSAGDDHWYSSNAYWSQGVIGTSMYRMMFGGSPLDPQAFANYRALSPSARGEHFSGPLLQQFAADIAVVGLELHQALRDATVPTELVLYRNEGHIFEHPRSRSAAASLNLDWFEYWLLGRQDPDPAKADRYGRWDAMRAAWKRAS